MTPDLTPEMARAGVFDISYLYKEAKRAENFKDYRTAVVAYNAIVEKAVASRTRCVQGMRTYGYHSWAKIGEALDMSAQGAWEKYSHSGLVTDPPDRVAAEKEQGIRHA